MSTIDRRTFLAGLAGSFAASANPQYPAALPVSATGEVCWLDVAAPFVVVDRSQELTTEILLTATCFPGVDGYRDTHNATQYQILLYDSAGKEIRLDNAGKLEIPAMRPTLLNMKDMSGRDSF